MADRFHNTFKLMEDPSPPAGIPTAAATTPQKRGCAWTGALVTLIAVVAIFIIGIVRDRMPEPVSTPISSPRAESTSVGIYTPAPTPMPTASPTPVPTPEPTTAPVSDFIREDSSNPRIYTVTVAHSPRLDYCQSSIQRLRNEGYNAYIYEAEGKEGYSILIGAWTSKDDAQSFADWLHTQPEVRGVKISGAYVLSKTRLSNDEAAYYSDPWF